jgi:hypothetical protein
VYLNQLVGIELLIRLIRLSDVEFYVLSDLRSEEIRKKGWHGLMRKCRFNQYSPLLKDPLDYVDMDLGRLGINQARIKYIVSRPLHVSLGSSTR